MTTHSNSNSGWKFSIEDIKLEAGPPKGVSVDGTVVKICESLCSEASNQDFEPILVTYSVAGGFGLELPRTAIFDRAFTNDTPEIFSSLNHPPVVENGAICFDLSAELGHQNRRLF